MLGLLRILSLSLFLSLSLSWSWQCVSWARTSQPIFISTGCLNMYSLTNFNNILYNGNASHRLLSWAPASLVRKWRRTKIEFPVTSSLHHQLFSTGFFCFFFSSRLAGLPCHAVESVQVLMSATSRAQRQTAPKLRDNMTLQCHTASGLPQSQLACHKDCSGSVIKNRRCQLSESSPASLCLIAVAVQFFWRG